MPMPKKKVEMIIDEAIKNIKSDRSKAQVLLSDITANMRERTANA